MASFSTVAMASFSTVVDTLLCSPSAFPSWLAFEISGWSQTPRTRTRRERGSPPSFLGPGGEHPHIDRPFELAVLAQPRRYGPRPSDPRGCGESGLRFGSHRGRMSCTLDAMTRARCPTCNGRLRLSQDRCWSGHEIAWEERQIIASPGVVRAMWAAVHALEDRASSARWRRRLPSPPPHLDETIEKADEEAASIRDILQSEGDDITDRAAG
jgi:hypothetical protein